MKENFTATQKEVVARKMGYNGPMQMFDEFLMSRPSDAQRYASITSKFAENMAKGGMVGYKNLASKGRNGDTMLAHINPEEAALLKARGGSGTINPQTGLREFYGLQQMGFLPQRQQEALPVLAQAFGTDEFKDIADKLPTTTVVLAMGSYNARSGVPQASEKINAEYDQYANKEGSPRSGTKITGYTVPTDKTFQDKPLVAQYDATGNFMHLTIDPQNALRPDPNQPTVYALPKFNKTGGIVDYGVGDTNNQDDGGFFSFVGELAKEFGPMILAGIGANYLAGSGLFTGGAGAAAAGGATAADITASNALAQANLTGYAGTAGFSAIPSGVGAATAAELAAGATGNFMTPELIAGAGNVGGATAAELVGGTGIKAATGTGFDLAATTGKTVGDAAINAAIGPTGTTVGNLAATTGGGVGMTAGSAGASAIGAGIGTELGAINTGVGAAGAASALDTAADLANKGKDVLDAVGDKKEEEKQPKDVSAAVSFLIDLLGKRTQGTRGERTYNAGGVVPTSPTAPTPTATITTTPTGATTPAEVATTQATSPTTVTATEVSAPSSVTEQQIAADAAQSKIVTSLTGVSAEQGTVSKDAQAQAATVVPTDTAVGKEQAAQGTATLVKEPADRVLQAGELVSGSAVDQKQVEAALAKTQAAQGTVTEDMTTQGQLNKLLTNFDAGKPPPWASASMRSVTAQLAARGLGASSIAGQAIVQATLEAALPIAAADAKVFEQMGLQNLSNRQQTAMVLAEQRAKFLGQEFDQNFQTKVLNAARIADIADKNFTADVTIALENARLTGTMDLQNLSNRQALVLAKTAQIANLETANLNNRQQVAVENAKAFLTLDVKNLDNRQQTALFKAKEIADSIISDTAAANAAKATNAANALEADKINAQLALSASQYNAAEKNKVAIFNESAASELKKFNAQESNDRAEFNANLAGQINIANAKLLADVSTSNTRETNAMAAVNAKNATDLSASTYAQLSQTYRDQLETTWKTSESVADRANEISKVTITANAAKYAGDAEADAAYYAALGSLSASLLSSSGGSTAVKSIVDTITGWFKKT